MQLSNIFYVLALASTAFAAAVDSSVPADAIVERAPDGPKGDFPNPNDGRGVVEAGDLLVSKGFARDGSDNAPAKRDTAMTPRKAEPEDQLFKRDCWYGKYYGCSDGWCYSKCGQPGQWCWLAANRGEGAWLKCTNDNQCSPKNTGVGCGSRCSCNP